jgi:hypothetical protein
MSPKWNPGTLTALVVAILTALSVALAQGGGA